MRKRKKQKNKRHQRYINRKMQKAKRTKKVSNKNVCSTIDASQMYCFGHIQQVLEYDALFGKNQQPTIESLLQYVTREQGIKIACLLSNSYNQATIDKLDNFFSSLSIENRRIVENQLQQFFKRRKNVDSIIWTTSETPLQLLRHLFAMPINTVKQNIITN